MRTLLPRDREHVSDIACPCCYHPLVYVPSDPRDADDNGHGSLGCDECGYSAEPKHVRDYEIKRTENPEE